MHHVHTQYNFDCCMKQQKDEKKCYCNSSIRSTMVVFWSAYSGGLGSDQRFRKSKNSEINDCMQNVYVSYQKEVCSLYEPSSTEYTFAYYAYISFLHLFIKKVVVWKIKYHVSFHALL